MTRRSIEKTSVFTKDIKKLPENVARKSWEIVQKLSINVFDNSQDIKKLHGFKNIWRVIVLKNYRLIFTFNENTLFLLRIAHRKDIYRKNIDFDMFD